MIGADSFLYLEKTAAVNVLSNLILVPQPMIRLTVPPSFLHRVGIFIFYFVLFYLVMYYSNIQLLPFT